LLIRESDNAVLGFSNAPSSGSGTESVSIGGIGLTGGVEYYVVVQGSLNSSSISTDNPLDISGNITIEPAPLPGALALFGSALVGFWGFVKRRKSRDEVPVAAAMA